MKLVTVFDKTFVNAELALQLHSFLSSLKQKKLRREWRDKFFQSRLYPSWPKKDGLKRLVGQQLFILGNDESMMSLIDCRTDYEALLLRSAISNSMAAFDKMMHEAVLQNFTKLSKNGTLDELIEFPISEAYKATQAARKRRGKGGKIKPRPGVVLKESAAELIFRETLLGTRRIELISGGLGIKKIWTQWGAQLSPKKGAETARLEWAKAYRRRNQIVHEVDSIRQLKSRTVKFHTIDRASAENITSLVKDLAHFLAPRMGH